jgi:hypothetical protein
MQDLYQVTFSKKLYGDLAELQKISGRMAGLLPQRPNPSRQHVKCQNANGYFTGRKTGLGAEESDSNLILQTP